MVDHARLRAGEVRERMTEVPGRRAAVLERAVERSCDTARLVPPRGAPAGAERGLVATVCGASSHCCPECGTSRSKGAADCSAGALSVVGELFIRKVRKAKATEVGDWHSED